MSIKINGLAAVITYQTVKAGRREKVVGSKIVIVLETSTGRKGVASASLGGNYNAEQALKEFQKAPQRFQPIEPGYTLAREMRLF